MEEVSTPASQGHYPLTCKWTNPEDPDSQKLHHNGNMRKQKTSANGRNKLLIPSESATRGFIGNKKKPTTESSSLKGHIPPNSSLMPSTITIRDLGQEDQKRIAAMITELASLAEEKEKLQRELEMVSKSYHNEKRLLEEDKRHMKTSLTEKEHLVLELQEKLSLSEQRISLLNSERNSVVAYNHESATTSHNNLGSQRSSILSPVTTQLSTNPFLTVSDIAASDKGILSPMERQTFTRDHWLHCFQSGALFEPPSSAFRPPIPTETVHTSKRVTIPDAKDEQSSTNMNTMQSLLLAQQKRLDEISHQLHACLLSGASTPTRGLLPKPPVSLTPGRSTSSCFVPIQPLNDFSIVDPDEEVETLSNPSSDKSPHGNVFVPIVPDEVQRPRAPQVPSPTQSLLEIIDNLPLKEPSYASHGTPSSNLNNFRSLNMQSSHVPNEPLTAIELSTTVKSSGLGDLNDPVLNDLFFIS